MHFVLYSLSTQLSTLLSILRRNQQKSFSFLMHFYMKIFTNPPSWTLFFEISPSKQTWTTQRTSGNVCISGCVGPKRQKMWWAGASLKNLKVHNWRQNCCRQNWTQDVFNLKTPMLSNKNWLSENNFWITLSKN